MKRILFLLLLILAAWPLAAQNHLVVYRLSGDVQLRRAGSAIWRPVASKDTLAPVDLLKVPEGGNVRILDLSDNALYRIGPTEVAPVRRLVMEAKKQARSITSRLNEELVADLRDQYPPSEDYSVKGVSYRGQPADNAFIRELASALSGHAESDGALSYEMVAEEDGGFHFILYSGYDVPLYVNVLRTCPGRMSLCFETSIPGNSCILLPPGRSIELSAYSFLEEDASYTVFGTVMPVDSRVLGRALDRATPTTAIPEGAIIGARK